MTFFFRAAVLSVACVVFFAGFGLTLSRADGEPPWPTEFETKAAFLFNISKFAQWPERNGDIQGSTFDICVVGSDPFQDAIDALEERTVAGSSLRVLRFARLVPETRTCRIAYIGSDQANRLAGILEALHGSGVLTVSDIPGFAEQGGMIELFTQQNRVRLAVNVDSVQRSGFRLRSQLLALARTIPEDAFSHARRFDSIK